MDTNSLSQLAQAAPQVQNTLNAWHLVALGAGAYLAHAYHSIKTAGGVKNILRGLWDGGDERGPQSNVQCPKPAAQSPESTVHSSQSPGDAPGSAGVPPAGRNAEGRMQNEQGTENLDARNSDIVNRKSPASDLGAPVPSPDTRPSSLL